MNIISNVVPQNPLKTCEKIIFYVVEVFEFDINNLFFFFFIKIKLTQNDRNSFKIEWHREWYWSWFVFLLLLYYLNKSRSQIVDKKKWRTSEMCVKLSKNV